MKCILIIVREHLLWREREREVLNFRIANYIGFQNKKIDQFGNYYLIICGHNSNKLIINHSVCVHTIIN